MSFALPNCWLTAPSPRMATTLTLIAYYGSHARGLASPTSDIDLFYTPVEGKDAARMRPICAGRLPL